MNRPIIQLHRCCFKPCRKPARWMVCVKVYRSGILMPGLQPDVLTRLNIDRTPVLVCEHHMHNMPAKPIEFCDESVKAGWEEAARRKYGEDNFGGYNYEAATWHFIRFDGAEVLPGALA